jgi:hypothetical protein
MNIETLVERYIALREKKAQIKAEYEAKVEHIDSLQSKVEGVLLRFFEEQGSSSIRTPAGTAYKATRVSATIADWDSFLEHVKANQAYEMLERRCSKVAVEQYKAANDELPPGVNWREDVVVNFRRS